MAPGDPAAAHRCTAAGRVSLPDPPRAPGGRARGRRQAVALSRGREVDGLRRVRSHLADPNVPDDLSQRLHRACDGPLPKLLPAAPPPSLTHGDLWAGNVVDGRWLVDPEVSYADRELDLAFMHMSDSLPPAFWAGYERAWPFDPGYERRRPALQLHHLLLQVRHFNPQRYRAGIEAVLDHYGW